MKRLRCALLGATGMMGQTFIRLLQDHPSFDLDVLFSSERNSGKVYGDEIRWYLGGITSEYVSDLKLREFSPNVLKEHEIDLVFSALPGSLARDLEAEAAGSGYPVFSNSATHRMDADVPILIPEINGDHIRIVSSQSTYPDGFIVTNPNCSTAGLALTLAPLIRFGPKRVFVSTYQALSGAGYKGPSAFSMQGNVMPFITNEEEKMERETGKILGRMRGHRIEEMDLEVHPSCTRVPVKNGHLLSVNMDMGEERDLEEIRDAFLDFKGLEALHSSPVNPVILFNDDDRPQPVLDSELGDPVPGMSVGVGRLRKKGSVVSCFAIVNNTVRGGAGNAILSAEMARERGIIGGGGH